MNRERIGALIDAIYAIAMTVLVLNFPVIEPGDELSKSIKIFLDIIVDYGLSFTLLFAFWYNQRRINDLVEIHSRLTLWLNGIVLMIVCLVPFSASLLYSFGKASFDYVSFVDLLFTGVCLSVDFFIHMSLWVICRTHLHTPEAEPQVVRIVLARRIVTTIVILVMVCSFLLPGYDRITLLALPLLLIFEDELVKIWEWIRLKLFT